MHVRHPLPFQREPHYPSWGFETRMICTALNGAARSHYPSWGFETRDHSPILQLLRELITPHGDLKLGGRRPILGRAVLITPHGDLKLVVSLDWLPGVLAHYPSWGFETTSVDTTITRSTVSLPLMGI